MVKLHPNAKDLTKQRFGRLAAIDPTEKRIKRSIVWRCVCDCGSECFISSDSLHSGRVHSCGCLQKELLIKRNTTHSMSKTFEYTCWRNMLTRCENSNYHESRYYKDRGISVCERWHDFENFIKDMGMRPEGLTIERIDNNKGYFSENCKGATQKEQNNNRRDRKNQRWFFAYNESIGEWDEDNNQVEFAKRWNICNINISACLHSKQKSHKGWIFERMEART